MGSSLWRIFNFRPRPSSAKEHDVICECTDTYGDFTFPVLGLRCHESRNKACCTLHRHGHLHTMKLTSAESATRRREKTHHALYHAGVLRCRYCFKINEIVARTIFNLRVRVSESLIRYMLRGATPNAGDISSAPAILVPVH